VESRARPSSKKGKKKLGLCGFLKRITPVISLGRQGEKRQAPEKKKMASRKFLFGYRKEDWKSEIAPNVTVKGRKKKGEGKQE